MQDSESILVVHDLIRCMVFIHIQIDQVLQYFYKTQMCPEGLHIQKDDQWLKVPVIPGALFVNLGDYAEIMSNGIFKSVIHRVVTNSERERFSVAAFCTPEPENEVGPINELISPNQPQLYKKVNMKTYKQLFFETYPLRVLDALRI